MLFCTVGTHEQPFDRLIRAVDAYARESGEECFCQIGYSTYEPVSCAWERLIPYARMSELFDRADVVVCHGAPATFMEVLRRGKAPVVVPRSERFGEHVNDHQVAFVRQVEARVGGIVPVYDVAELPSAIGKARMMRGKAAPASHSAAFCEGFERIVEGLLG